MKYVISFDYWYEGMYGFVQEEISSKPDSFKEVLNLCINMVKSKGIVKDIHSKHLALSIANVVLGPGSNK